MNVYYLQAVNVPAYFLSVLNLRVSKELASTSLEVDDN